MCSNLAVLEPLLHEFYASTTPNDRKRHIESELLAFKNQPEAWKSCLHFLNNTIAFERNQFLWFFCTSTLEHFITRRWMHLNNSDRMLLRENFWNIYVNLNKPANCQRDTIAKLIALLGKRQFPEQDPNYMDHCVLLIKTKFALGICLLRTTSEEVVSCRVDISIERKQYFHSCISMFMSDVTELLTKYIVIAVCYINGRDIHSVSEVNLDHSLIQSLPKDNHFNSTVTELLACLQHLISWNSTDLITELFLRNVFNLAQWRSAHPNVSLAALSVLNEIFYLQKPLPHAFVLMSGVTTLLEQLINDKVQNVMYLDKFRELLRSFTIKYWPKILQDSATLEAFLKALYLATVLKSGTYDFTEKLEIWMQVIRGLNEQNKLNRYHEIMDLLVNEVMRRTQFEYNKTELELLDIKSLDDNIPADWQQYLNQCFECIALIAESRPAIVFAQVFNHWSRLQVYLQSIENDLDCGRNFQAIDAIKCHSFAEHLRDFTTVCQVVVRIAPLLNSNNCEKLSDVNPQLDALAGNLLEVLNFFTSNKLSALNANKSIFQADFENLYVQILMAIYHILPAANAIKNDCMLYRLCDCLDKIFQQKTYASSLIYTAASQVVLCISSVIRPKFLLNIPAIGNLMHGGAYLSFLPVHALANIYFSLISYLLLPWKHYNNEPQLDDNNRSALLRDYIDSIFKSFLELNTKTITNHTQEGKASAIVSSVLSPFALVMDAFKDSSNTAKDVLVAIFKPIINQALNFYNCFAHNNNCIAKAVTEFSLSTLRTLQAQLGSQYIKDMITLFITVNSRGESPSLRRVSFMEKILQMFQLIVEQPGNASLAMMPAILNFTFDNIMPLMQHDTHITDNTNANYVLYNLFNSVLCNKWQYFYKSHLQANGTLNSNENLHPEHFMSIMNAYGQALVSASDTNLVYKVLISMQNIDERWRLYQRPLFRESLLNSFQNALIKMLLATEGALHFDLLASILFTMSQIDVLKLRENFAQVGLPPGTKLIDEICLTTDIPTFAQKLLEIRHDYHYVYLTHA